MWKKHQTKKFFSILRKTAKKQIVWYRPWIVIYNFVASKMLNRSTYGNKLFIFVFHVSNSGQWKRKNMPMNTWIHTQMEMWQAVKKILKKMWLILAESIWSILEMVERSNGICNCQIKGRSFGRFSFFCTISCFSSRYSAYWLCFFSRILFILPHLPIFANLLFIILAATRAIH